MGNGYGWHINMCRTLRLLKQLWFQTVWSILCSLLKATSHLYPQWVILRTPCSCSSKYLSSWRGYQRVQQTLPYLPTHFVSPPPPQFWVSALGWLVCSRQLLYSNGLVIASRLLSVDQLRIKKHELVPFSAKGWRVLGWPQSWMASPRCCILRSFCFVFFAGLVDLLFANNHLITYSTLGIVSLCATLYLIVTFLPAIRHYSPYKTPLSGVCWWILQFLGLLQYIGGNDNRKNINGGSKVGKR